MGKYEFTLLIRGNEEIASQLSQRFISTWAIGGSSNITPSYAFVTKSEDESGLEMLDRLDLCTLLTPTF